MNLRKIAVSIFGVALVVGAWRAYGWPGVALVTGGIVMWGLLHFTRMMRVLQMASHRPVGWVDSAVMFNARLRPGLNLLHVLAMTRALGEQLSAKDAQPEVFRWTDGTASSVTCEFADGKLVKWQLVRPQPTAADSPALTGSPPPAGNQPPTENQPPTDNKPPTENQPPMGSQAAPGSPPPGSPPAAAP